MKKIFILAAAVLSLGFTACEDVPAPYGINTDVLPDSTDTSGAIINAPLSSSLGVFTAVNTVGDYSWAIDESYGYVKVTSYVDSENHEAESWLISAPVSLADVTSAHVTFDYVLRYANASDLPTNYLLRFSKDYSGDPSTATWVNAGFTAVSVSSWTDWTSVDVNVPSEFIGQDNVVVALYYKAESKAATWEVKNFKLLEGAAADSGDDSDTETTRTLPYNEAFSSTLGGFTNYTTSGSGAWTISYSAATATGYSSSTSTTTAGTYYLVSPEISLDGQTAAYISYDYILRYNRDQVNQEVYITTSFDETNPAEGWTLLNGTHTEGSDWDTFSTAQVNIPSEYMGQTIRLAFRFNCDSSNSSTWEVKNFSIQAGQVDSGDDDTPSGETVDVISNGGFENWTNGTPDDWTSTTTASSATISQSTDAHTGSYSVLVGGNESQNKRLGSKEYTLEAGTYTMTCYVKGAGQVRPGYTTVVDGVASSSYQYGSYISTTADEWTEVTNSFTLTEQTTVNFVLMNPKTSNYATASDKLVDDFSVTTSDGGVAE